MKKYACIGIVMIAVVFPGTAFAQGTWNFLSNACVPAAMMTTCPAANPTGMNCGSINAICTVVPGAFFCGGGWIPMTSVAYYQCVGASPAPTASLSAAPANIVSGGNSALTWSSTDATTCTGTNFNTGGAVSGSVVVSPLADTTYTVDCTGPGGDASQSATVTVAPAGGGCWSSTGVIMADPGCSVFFANLSGQACAPLTSSAWSCTSNGLRTLYSCAPCGGTPPDLSVTPALDFGTVPILTAPAPQTITVSNAVGTSPTTVTIPSPVNVGANAYTFVPSSFPLNPGASQNVSVTFSAGALAGNADTTVTLAGTGGANAPSVDLYATVDDGTDLWVREATNGWANVSVGYARTLTGIPVTDPDQFFDFVIRNTALVQMDYNVSLAGDPRFTLSGACSGTNITTGSADQVCTVTFDTNAGAGTFSTTVTFDNLEPTGANPPDPITATITVTVSSDPTARIYPGSTNPPASCVPNPSSGQPTEFNVDMGSVPIGNFTERNITIVNEGDQALTGSISTPPGAPFTIVAGGGVFTLPNKNDARTIRIRFTPTAPGACPGVPANCGFFVIDTNDPAFPGSGNVRVNLAGTGVAVPVIEFSPAATGPFPWGGGPGFIDFGDQDIYSGYIARTIRIDNIGTAASNVSLAVDNPAYTLVPASNNVPVGASRDFEVRFDPAAVGPHPATITITASGLAGQSQVFLNGNGIITPPDVAPGTISFGNVVVSRQKDLAVTIENNDALGRDFGVVDLSLLDPQFTCINPSPCQIALPVGASPTVTLRFTPTSIGAKMTQLLFSGGQNGINGFVIPVDGMGIRPSIRYEEN